MSEASDSRMLTGGQAMAEALIENGVDTVFGIPGIQLDPLFDAFYQRQNQLNVLHTRHEQGAAFMAMGYAQASDRTGVFAVVPGPGLLNAMSAVSTAVATNTPVLGITGQIPSPQIQMGYGIAHELRDQLGMSAGVVGWAKRARHPAEVGRVVNDAFNYMNSGRKQPAVLEMAPDQYYAIAPVVSAGAATIDSAPVPDGEKIAAMAGKLAAARHPAVFIGGGVYGAQTPLLQLAERLNAPVIVSPSGLGAISDAHPLAFNILCGQEIWDRVDVALVVGTRFLAPALAWGRAAEVDVLRIDIDADQLRKPRPASIGVVTSAALGLAALCEQLPVTAPARTEYLDYCRQCAQKLTARLAEFTPLPEFSAAIRRALPDDGILVNDVTQLAYYTRFGYPVYQPRSWMTVGYQATLGYALPAALGAKVACPDRAVVSISGDGGVMFTIQELATAVQHNICAVHIVLDNSAYGNVKTIQAQRFGSRHIAVDLVNPDFVALAQSFGISAAIAHDAQTLEQRLKEFLDQQVPALIHVPIGEVPSIWDLVRRPPTAGV